MSVEHTNALSGETSPYLLQHARNPVDWLPWGEAALSTARAERKLIFLSIGYSACHWCHVMEHECFEDPDVAELLNREFVPVKVDREERPDLDEIYMTATMVFTGGHGGWPMSVFLAPDLKPIFAGTYFPRESAHGRPGFLTILRVLSERWKDDPDSLLVDAEKVVAVIRQNHAGASGGGPVSPGQLRAAAEAVLNAFDPARGGIPSGSNKFPPSLAVNLLLRQWKATSYHPFLSAVELTLEKMGHGGIYDHLGGGIHRYSTDPRWLVPHFEKMLYDQALVADAYLAGMQATSDPALKRLAAERVRGICDYVLRDLASPDGGFYSSEDADSEGLEGKFYVWTRAEVSQVLDDEITEKVFCTRYDVSPPGNWMHPGDEHVPAGPKNILQIVRDIETIASAEHLPVDEVERRIARAREKLFAQREKRVRPALDDKILAGWNGLMITALARAGALLEEPRYLAAAARSADFILASMRRQGRLFATYGRGSARHNAYSADYAFLIEGLLALYEAGGDFTRVEQAGALTDILIRHYGAEQGGFYFTADDHEELLVRTRTAQDGATPSANSVMLDNLLRLSTLLHRRDLRDRAEQVAAAFGSDAARLPFQSERLLAGIDALQQGLLEIVIVGAPDDDRTRELLRRVAARYLPNKLVARLDPAAEVPAGPLFAGRQQIDSKPTAYVCRDYACLRPTSDPQELAHLLESPFD